MSRPRAYHLRARGEEATVSWGARVAAVLPPGAVVALVGELGAGKTTLARGLCQGLGVGELGEVVSPSFSLLNEYEGERPVAHFDFYRLNSINSLPELDFDDVLASGATVLIEWADRFPAALPPERTIWIRLEPSVEDPDVREIVAHPPPPQRAGRGWEPLRKMLGES